MTREQMIERFEREIVAMKCLEAEGHDVPSPPSLEVYLETFPTAGPRTFSEGESFAFWTAYGTVVGNVSQSEYERLMEVCPPPG